jgi:hypothetical protein
VCALRFVRSVKSIEVNGCELRTFQWMSDSCLDRARNLGRWKMDGIGRGLLWMQCVRSHFYCTKLYTTDYFF